MRDSEIVEEKNWLLVTPVKQKRVLDGGSREGSKNKYERRILFEKECVKRIYCRTYKVLCLDCGGGHLWQQRRLACL